MQMKMLNLMNRFSKGDKLSSMQVVLKNFYPVLQNNKTERLLESLIHQGQVFIQPLSKH